MTDPLLSTQDRRYVVVKLGGSVLPHREAVLEDVAALRTAGYAPVLVHGGGASVTAWLQRIGKEAVFVDGLRVTDAETLEAALMVLAGKVNKELVALLGAAGVPAVGLSGVDGGILHARRLRTPDLGFVGEVREVDVRPLEALTAAGYVPVIAPLACGNGDEILNINADTVAGDVARALGAEVLLFLTDVPGVRGGDGSVLRVVDTALAGQLRRDGVVTGGMIPKVDACLRAIDGVRAASIVDGSVTHAIRRLLLDNEPAGTTFVA